jgi:RimJ/RimL family protein N-acetyltransferase
MTIFETERLSVRELAPKDKNFFIELVSAPEIIEPIPQAKWSSEEVLERFEEFRSYSHSIQESERVVWGVFEKDLDELIGLCGLLTNDENDREIGYRFRKPFWGKGYGIEVTRNMIQFCFQDLNIEFLTADTNVTNVASVKILERFFTPVREFYNEADKCTDRRYELKQSNWTAPKI